MRIYCFEEDDESKKAEAQMFSLQVKESFNIWKGYKSL